MIREKFIDFLKGYVVLFGEGGFPERFINLCSSNKIDIRNVKMYKDTIIAECGIKSYGKIRKIAKKSGMKVRIVSKHGLPFFIHRNRKRTGIIFGLVFMVVMTMLLSGRIWVISVSGNEKIPAEEILNSFCELGVKTGVKKDGLNAKEIASRSLTEVDGIMWSAVNIDGCRVTIEIKEQVKKEIVTEEKETPSNIAASDSGQIIKIENFIGTPVVQPGSAVEKGDIIVSGAVINKDESVSFYKADANVIARTKNTVSSAMAYVQDMRVYSKVKKKKFITFFAVTLPLNYVNTPKGEYDFSRTEDFLSSDGGKLPVGITEEKFSSYEKQKVRLTAQAVKLMCAEKYFYLIDNSFDDIQTENMTSEIRSDKNSFSILSTFECIENIAERVPMDLTLSDET